MDAMEQVQVFSNDDAAQQYVQFLYGCGYEGYTVRMGEGEVEVRWNTY